MPSFEWSKVDDLMLFGAWAGMTVIFLLSGYPDMASYSLSGWIGAVAMYLRGDGEGKKV
jgi:hypothetical protein